VSGIPAVSVALCAHNGARFVRRQLASILAQTQPPAQLVVSDDASADDTLAIIEQELVRVDHSMTAEEFAARGREVEARALIHGLHLALQNGCDRLVVEGDDLTLVRLLRGDSPHTRIPWAMYNQIVQLLSYFRDVVVQHVYREGNAVADALCHEAYRCSNLWTDLQLVPPAVRAKLEDDRRGVVHPRYRSA
jgi:glycosyltransferase involved in cell wall biosynthesis